MAKRFKVDDKLIHQVLTYVRQGNFVVAACRAVGISPSAWTYHCKKNPHVKELTEKAYYEAEVNAVSKIVEKGHDDDPRYLQWFLSRKHPERWGDNKREIEKLQNELAELRSLIGKLTGGAVSTD